MSGPLRALVALELRRNLAAYGRFLLGVAGVLAILAASGWVTPPRLAFVTVVVGTTLLMQVPGTVVRDRLDGGLEFLVSLPVPRSLIARARLTYALVASVPCAIGFTAAAALLAPASAGALPGGLWTLFVWIFVVVVLCAFLMVGWTLRFEARQATNGFIGLVVGMTALGGLVPRVLPDPLGATLRLLARPWAPWALGAGASIVIAGLLWLSFHLARTGLERFTPGRERITW